jgi:phage baseplate assembly protein W
MPIPQAIRVSTLDLQKTRAIGYSLPFNGPAGPFNRTYSTLDQTKYNLINLILTVKGERIFNPQFGVDLQKILFEGITDETISLAKTIIIQDINTFLPSLLINEIVIEPDVDQNSISVTVIYTPPLSNKKDQIKVQFT